MFRSNEYVQRHIWEYRRCLWQSAESLGFLLQILAPYAKGRRRLFRNSPRKQQADGQAIPQDPPYPVRLDPSSCDRRCQSSCCHTMADPLLQRPPRQQGILRAMKWFPATTHPRHRLSILGLVREKFQRLRHVKTHQQVQKSLPLVPRIPPQLPDDQTYQPHCVRVRRQVWTIHRHDDLRCVISNVRRLIRNYS